MLLFLLNTQKGFCAEHSHSRFFWTNQKFKKRISNEFISLIVITVLFSFCAIAGNDPVNCKDVKIGELKLYSEWASCEVGGYYLEQYFFPTTQRVHQLTKFIYGGNYVQCATLTGNVGDTFNVVGKVTDNDGNTDSTSRTIKLVYRPVEMCGQYPC